MKKKPLVAMDELKILTLEEIGAPGSTLPSHLSGKILRAAIRDLQQVLQRRQDLDSDGSPYIRGPFYLVTRLLVDKGLEDIVDKALDDTNTLCRYFHDYQLELELEYLKRRFFSYRVESATLDTIFEYERNKLLYELMGTYSGYLN